MMRLRDYHVRIISTERLLAVLAQLGPDDALRPPLEVERQRRRAAEQRRAAAKHALEWGP